MRIAIIYTTNRKPDVVENNQNNKKKNRGNITYVTIFCDLNIYSNSYTFPVYTTLKKINLLQPKSFSVIQIFNKAKQIVFK